MPARISKAYAGFLTSITDDGKNNQILHQKMLKQTAENILSEIDNKKPLNTYTKEERDAFITLYTNKDDYDVDTMNENVFIHKKRGEINLEKELKVARKVADLENANVYLLPSSFRDSDGIIIKGRKTPDALVKALFVDFKTLGKVTKYNVLNEFGKGALQADAIAFDILDNVNINEISKQIEHKLAYTDDISKYNDKKIVIFDASDSKYFLEIKNGAVNIYDSDTSIGMNPDASIELDTTISNTNPDPSINFNVNYENPNVNGTRILNQKNLTPEEKVAEKVVINI